jgi:hypothetical protein
LGPLSCRPRRHRGVSVPFRLHYSERQGCGPRVLLLSFAPPPPILPVPRPPAHVPFLYRLNDLFLTMLEKALEQVESTLFVWDDACEGSTEPPRLRTAFSDSTLTWAQWRGRRETLFVRPLGSPSGAVVDCGHMVAITMSAVPDKVPVEDSWDAEQCQVLVEGLRTLFQRNQHRQIVALADAADRTIRKIRQVGGFPPVIMRSVGMSVCVCVCVLASHPTVFLKHPAPCLLMSRLLMCSSCSLPSTSAPSLPRWPWRTQRQRWRGSQGQRCWRPPSPWLTPLRGPL